MVFFSYLPSKHALWVLTRAADIEAVLKSMHNPCFLRAKDCVPKPSTVILMTI